jgi:hypothetical protein
MSVYDVDVDQPLRENASTRSPRSSPSSGSASTNVAVMTRAHLEV